MTVKLTQPLFAFRIDDAVLERLWHVLESKCAEAGPAARRTRRRPSASGSGSRIAPLDAAHPACGHLQVQQLGQVVGR